MKQSGQLNRRKDIMVNKDQPSAASLDTLDSLVSCACCTAPAKYEVAGTPSCGRHLAYLINMGALGEQGYVRVYVKNGHS